MFSIFFYKKIGSTNSKAKTMPKHGTVIVAQEQTEGRGRFKREWFSEKGGLYFSVVLRSDKVANLRFLTFMAAIALHKAVKEHYGLKCTIKWPNDLMIGKKKLAGILTESIIGNKVVAIIGIGINTNNALPSGIRAESLSRILKRKINNRKLLQIFLHNLEEYLKLVDNGKHGRIISDWKRRSFLGSEVRVCSLKGEYTGIAYNVNDDCCLVLKKNNKYTVIEEGDVYIC